MLSQLFRKLSVTGAFVGAVVLSAGALTQGQVTARQVAPKAKAIAKALLDLNKASAAELEELPGIGAATAKKIIAGRPYTKLEDLSKAGVPARTIEGIRALVTVAPPQAPRSKKAAVARAEAGKVNINTADLETLETLPGIGRARAHAIMEHRPYKSIDDLEQVKGVGRAGFARIRDLVTTSDSEASAASTAVTTKESGARRAGRRIAAAKAMSRLAPGQKININTASLEQLELLPGIGPVRGQAIIDARKTQEFKTIEDIMKVKGIKEGEFARIKDMITVK